MFRTHSPQSKQTVVAIGMAGVLVVLIIINLITILPSMLDVYSSQKIVVNNDPIDTTVVNEAINALR